MASIEVNVTYSASLRIFDKSLDPDTVSKRLGLTPDESHRAGDPHLGQSGRRYADFSVGMWSIRSLLHRSAAPDDHITGLLARLQNRGEALRELSAQGYKMDLFLGVFGIEDGNHGFSIASETMKALGDLGIKLEIDAYG